LPPGGQKSIPMLQLEVRSVRRLPAARHAVRAELLDRGFDDRDVSTLELVVAELLGAAYDSDLEARLVILIETFAQLHSVRLRGVNDIDLGRDSFHLRERVLHQLTLAFGQRRNADGTTDLWAEVPRTTR
jgi:hypothetical protein